EPGREEPPEALPGRELVATRFLRHQIRQALWLLLLVGLGFLLLCFGLRVFMLVRDDLASHRVDVHFFDAGLAGHFDVVGVDQLSILALLLVRLLLPARPRRDRCHARVRLPDPYLFAYRR